MLMAQIALLLERGADERFETRRYQGIDMADWLRRAIEDRVEDDRLRAPGKGLGPRRHLIQHHAQREQVRPSVHLLTPRLLG